MSEEEQQVTVVPAGEQLKHLREQKNLSVQDIANRLNLKAQIIEAIERDEYDSLAGAIYVRGYLRSYAKLLDADTDAILAAYNNSVPEEPPEIIPEVKHSSQTSSSDKPVRAFTYLVTLCLAILLIAWWYSQNLVEPVDTADLPTSEDSEAPPGLPYEIPVVVHSKEPFYSEPEEEEIVAEEAMPGEGPSVEEAELNPGMDTSVPNSSDAPEPAAGESGDSPDDYPLVVSSDSEGPDSLVLTLHADSWIEVYDSNEDRVFVNLGREGQVISLRGTAPFRVILGFAEGVNVEFNGEAFDPAPYTNDSIARFSLDN